MNISPSPLGGHQFNPGNARSDGVVDRAAVPMDGPLNNVAAPPAIGDSRPALPVLTQVADKAHQSVDKVAEAVTPTAKWLSAKVETLAAAPRNAVADARDYVSANPWQSLAVAVAAGFALGRLTR